MALALLFLPANAFAQLQILDVPFISQSEDLCGGAAAAMVLRYWGARGIDAESFSSLLDRGKAGIETTTLVADLNRRGWNAAGVRGSDPALRDELAAGRPVIALIQDRPGRYHYVVVVAATDRAIVFHDPARAPLRVMSSEEFGVRWRSTGNWMAIVTPKRQLPTPNSQSREPDAKGPKPDAQASPSTCDALVAEGVRRAQANDVAGAERALTSALGCPGAAPLRELAGVRVLQKRWADAASLASAATAQDPHDEYLWRLLGTARFLLDDPVGALQAWNAIDEPKIDIVRVDGLTRTRERVVEQLTGVGRNELLTPDRLLRARRRVAELPAAFSTRVDFTPVPSGLAELHAVVAERQVVPSDAWALAGLALGAAAERDVRVVTGSLTGGGESLSATWRFWPNRPRIAVRLSAPTSWGAIWSVDADTETQPFSINAARIGTIAAVTPGSTSRTTARLSAAAWMTPVVRLGVRGGMERWDSPSAGVYGTAGVFALYSSRDDTMQARFAADIYTGQDRSFGTTDGAIAWRSKTARAGHVWLADGGVSFAAHDTPLGSWFAGDTGHSRAVLLRAHPVLADDGLRVERLGRVLLHASGEAQQWWTVKGLLHVGAAAFVDHARTAGRLTGDPLSDVDAGVGLRLAAPLLPGVVRLDVAKGLRDRATAWSVVYAR